MVGEPRPLLPVVVALEGTHDDAVGHRAGRDEGGGGEHGADVDLHAGVDEGLQLALAVWSSVPSIPMLTCSASGNSVWKAPITSRSPPGTGAA